MWDEKIWESAKQKLLGMELGRNLNFDDHVSSLCKKARRKIVVLARLPKFMSSKQKRMSLSLDIVHLNGCFIAGRQIVK